MGLTCSEGGKARAGDGEAVHRLTTAAACAASCGGAQDQTAPSVASSVLKPRPRVTSSGCLESLSKR